MPVVPEEKNLGKRSELKQQNVWFLNKELESLDDWGEDGIEKRCDDLLCVAKRVWTYPNSSDNN